MSMIEINWKPESSQLRNFGWIGLVAFGAIGALIYFRRHLFGFDFSPGTAATTAYVLWGVAGLCGALAAVAPALLKPLYVGLTLITLPIGYVVSHVVMALLFYGLFTPVGLIFRLIGRDPMHRAFEPNAKSYWTPRHVARDPRRYFRQF